MAWGLRNVSSRELSEWAAYLHQEPFGEVMADYRAGIVAATVANVNRGSKGKALEPKDFMPKHWFDKDSDDEPGEDDWRNQMAMAAMITAAMGGTDKRKA